MNRHLKRILISGSISVLMIGIVISLRFAIPGGWHKSWKLVADVILAVPTLCVEMFPRPHKTIHHIIIGLSCSILFYTVVFWLVFALWDKRLKPIFHIRLRYKLLFANLALLFILGIVNWPLNLDRFAFTPLKYLDPLILWNFQNFAFRMNNLRMQLGFPFSLQFYQSVVICHYLLLALAGSAQWLIIGICFERIGDIRKQKLILHLFLVSFMLSILSATKGYSQLIGADQWMP
jgi:hypothetical protein